MKKRLIKRRHSTRPTKVKDRKKQGPVETLTKDCKASYKTSGGGSEKVATKRTREGPYLMDQRPSFRNIPCVPRYNNAALVSLLRQSRLLRGGTQDTITVKTRELIAAAPGESQN